MDEIVRERVLEMARQLILNHSTVRAVAKKVGYSKSTVHKDLTEKLPLIDLDLSEEVNGILMFNKKIRHIRGGQSTKLKYSHMESKL